MNDPDFELKVRERSPKDLIALQLEVWSTNIDRSRRDRAAKDRKAREFARAENKQDETTELLKKRVIELEKKLMDLQKGNQAESLSTPNTENQPTECNQTTPKAIAETTGQSKESYQPKERTCCGCSDPNHRLWQCPKLSYAKKMMLDRKKIRSIGDHDQQSCITVRLRGKSIQALIDTGSDVTIAGSNIAKVHRWKILPN